MKKEMWICTVLAAALVLAVCSTPVKAADNINEEAYLRAAQLLFEMKTYEQAKNILQEVKTANPVNTKARELLAKVNEELAKTGAAKAKPVTREDLEKVIKEVDFTDARIEEVVSYLAVKSNVNIVFSREAIGLISPAMKGIDEKTEEPGVFDDVKDEAEGPLVEEIPTTTRDIGGITIRLKDVPLKAVLKYVLQMKGLKYIVEDYAIVIVPQNYEPHDDMEIEIFKIYGGVFGGMAPTGTGY